MNYFGLVCLLFSVQCVFSGNQTNNVCRTFEDYYKDLYHNPNCYHNPDVYLSVPEIVQRRGYPIESHTVTTQDGYILTIFRIPHGKDTSRQLPGPPVFIQHGISVSSMVFVNLGEKSLAFILADNGFDVWLGNFRGSAYSSNHTHFANTDKHYWNFTFHENGVYDLPAQLDFVAQKTQQKLFYIGYSMGSTAYFVYNVEYPDVARERIKVAISLAPAAFLHYIDQPLRFLASFWTLFQNKIYDATGGVLFQRTFERVAQREKKCLPYPYQMDFCQLSGFVLFGFDPSQRDPETHPVVTMQDVDSIGVKTVTHYVQLIHSGRFQQFDYGWNNQKVYGTSVPPQYDLSKINVPNYFIRANSDPIVTKKNVEVSFSALPEKIKPFRIYEIKHNEFTHSDFISAKDVKQLVYDPIVKFMKDVKNIFL